MGRWFAKQQISSFGADAGVKPTLRKGMKGGSGTTLGTAIREWQSILGVAQDGDFGSGTDAKTKAWQSSRKLNPDGVVGPATWAAALGPAKTATAQTVKPAVVLPKVTQNQSVVVSHPTLRKGSHGPDVTEWQNIIGATPADGIFGVGTEAKTKAFQSAAGITPDGIVGPQTWMVAHVAHATMPQPVASASNPLLNQDGSLTSPGSMPGRAVPKMATPPAKQVAKAVPLRVVDPSGEFPAASRPAPAPVPTALKDILVKGRAPKVDPKQATVVTSDGQMVVSPANAVKQPWYKSVPILAGAGAVVVGIIAVVSGSSSKKKHAA